MLQTETSVSTGDCVSCVSITSVLHSFAKGCLLQFPDWCSYLYSLYISIEISVLETDGTIEQCRDKLQAGNTAHLFIVAMSDH